MYRRFLVVLVPWLLVAACSDNTQGDDSTTLSPTTLPPTTVVQVVPGGTYTGPIEAQPNLTGWVTIEVSASGDEIVGLIFAYDMTDYGCGGGITVNGPGAVAPIGIGVPISGGAFRYEASYMLWVGTFTSESVVEGTVEGNLVNPDCDFGPFTWSADLEDIAPPNGDAATTSQAVTTTVPWVVPPEYTELCAITQRILDRVETAPPGFESGTEFWIAQRDDHEAMVDLVPAELRADMEIRAGSWRQFIDLLDEYDFVFDAMVADVGVEAVNQIFLADDVLAAGARIDSFLAATCLGE